MTAYAITGLGLVSPLGVGYPAFEAALAHWSAARPDLFVDHPSILEGTIDEIADSARALTARDGVDGLDLLAYRWTGDVPALVKSVVAASVGPVIAAGSVDSAQRIQALADAGAWAFTIGGAIFDRKLPAGPSVREQVDCALAMTAAAAGREVVADGA